MSGALFLHNRQRTRKINSALLRKIISGLLDQILKRDEYELGLHLVTRRKITELNEAYLQHQGSTDVITFDYSDPARPQWLAGDIFICVAEAVEQARQFKTTWQSEIVRYVVHGLLHLCGYDDRSAKDRLKMKTEEDRCLALLAKQFAFARLAPANDI